MSAGTWGQYVDEFVQINLKIDPEGAKVALTADFPSISEFQVPSQYVRGGGDVLLKVCSDCGQRCQPSFSYSGIPG